jgi:hypothetical protein
VPLHSGAAKPEQRGFAVVTHSGKKWHTIGSTETYTIDEVRDRARKIIKAARDGTAAPDSLEAVAANWCEQHLEGKGLKSHKAIDHCLLLFKNEWGWAQLHQHQAR